MSKLKQHFPEIICFTLCVIIIISAPLIIINIKIKENADADDAEMTVLTVWQIDSFEGGRGSRADYLQKLSEEFSDCYILVTSISAEAARNNIIKGTMPDIISYGAGIFGIENYIKSYKTWCNGGYCILTLEENSDFSDLNTKNTIINGGINNLSSVAALFCGLNGAASDRPTGAYVKLINGKYKYLLGTQRDIFRLKTRGVAFSIMPVTEFNDLYQNISVIATEKHRIELAEKFIDFLLQNSESINKLGLMKEGLNLYDDELKELEGISYKYKLAAPIGNETYEAINNAVASDDINLLKNLLK